MAGQHLTFGGSTAHRWLRCPGSARLSATLPPQMESAAMAEGTRAHALLEHAVSRREDDVTGFSGLSLEPHWPAFTDEDVEAVQVAVDYINDLIAQDKDHVLWVEQQVSLTEDVGGTADVIIYHPSSKTLHVIDYKHGRGKYVEAEGNPQVKLYAAAALMGATDHAINVIRGTIIQPRCALGSPIRTAMFGPGDLLNYIDDVEIAVADATSDAPTFSPGEEQCKWCPAATICPALRGKAVTVVEPAQALVLPADESVTLTIPPASACRDPKMLGETLKVAEVLRAWIDAIEDAAEEAAKGGAVVPGFKLVEKQARREWTDEDKAKAFLGAGELLLPADDYAPRKLVTVARAEKLVKKAGGKEAVAKLAGLSIKESSGTKLVPESAPGDAVDPRQLGRADFAAAITV